MTTKEEETKSVPITFWPQLKEKIAKEISSNIFDTPHVRWCWNKSCPNNTTAQCQLRSVPLDREGRCQIIQQINKKYNNPTEGMPFNE